MNETQSKLKIFKFVKKFTDSKGFPPTFSEIATATKYSRALVGYRIQELKTDGKITYVEGKSRTIKVLEH